jgi:hypothetical protein
MAESYTGEVRNGVVVFDEGTAHPPEGMKVRVEPADLKAALRELSERLLELAGTVEGLPEDYAESLDHYVHGLPKR